MAPAAAQPSTSPFRPTCEAGDTGAGNYAGRGKFYRGKAVLSTPDGRFEAEFQGVTQRFFGIDDLAEFSPLGKGRRGHGQGEHRDNKRGNHDLGTHPTPSLKLRYPEKFLWTLPLHGHKRQPQAQASPPYHQYKSVKFHKQEVNIFSQKRLLPVRAPDPRLWRFRWLPGHPGVRGLTGGSPRR